MLIYDVSSLCSCEHCGEEFGAAEKLISGKFAVFLVSSGSVYCEESAGVLPAGSLVVFKGGLRFKLADKAHAIAAVLSGAAAQKAAESLSAPVVTDCGACPMAAEILSLLLSETDESRLARLGFELICELAHAGEKTTPLPALVASALSEMHKSYAQIFGVEELSQGLGVSKSHLVRVFSQSMGIPPGQYLTRVRIDAAKLMLLQRNYPLELIATLCGFSGANYLCKVFKRETGLTPAAYRRKALEKTAPSKALSDLESALFV